MDSVNAIEGGEGVVLPRAKAERPQQNDSLTDVEIPMVPDEYQLSSELRVDLLTANDELKDVEQAVSENQVDEQELMVFLNNLENIEHYLDRIASNAYTLEENNQLMDMIAYTSEQDLEMLENSSVAGTLTQNQSFNMSVEDLGRLVELHRTMSTDEKAREQSGEIAAMLKDAVTTIKNGKTIYERKLEALGEDALTQANQMRAVLNSEKGLFDIIDIGWASSMTAYIIERAHENPEMAENAHGSTKDAALKLLQ